MGPHILEKVVERLFGEIPGFAWLFFILILLCHPLHAEGFFGVIMALILSWAFLLPSNLLDHLFDRLYGPKPDFRLGLLDADNKPKNQFSLVVERTFATRDDFVMLAEEKNKPAPRRIRFTPLRRRALDSTRRDVADRLGEKICSERYPNFPLYESSELILRPTEKWSQVNSWLQLSKVARAFILPLLAIAVFDGFFNFFNSNWTETLLSAVGAELPTEHGTQGHSPIMTIIRPISTWVSNFEDYIGKLIIVVLSKWWAALVLFCLATWGYLGARIHSMQALYKEASKAEWVHTPPLSSRPRRSMTPASVTVSRLAPVTVPMLSPDASKTKFEGARTNMIDSQIRPNKVTDDRVIAAFAKIRRELFVPKHLWEVAYIDEDLPLGGGRYLMEPMVAARLVQAAALERTDTILIVGGATGYEAALVSVLTRNVFALEDDPELARRARDALVEHAIASVTVVEGPLSQGYRPRAPYDVILFGGAVAEVPPEISSQLAEDGRLLAVVKPSGTIGRTTLMTRTGGILARRVIFDAATPLLPGFLPKPAFVFC